MSQADGKHVFVSVVVPTKNSESEIRKCLDSVKLQSYSKIEIIVVDDESRDKTREIAEKYGAKVVNIRSGRSKARNIGAKISKGEFILFMDSDQELDRDLISRAVELATFKKLDAVRFPKIIKGDSFFGKVRTVESYLNYREGKIRSVPRYLKKSTFLKSGGYDEKLAFGEDRELWKRLIQSGYKLGVLDVPIYEIDNSIQKRLTKNYKYGMQYLEYQKKVADASTVLFESVNILKYIKSISSTSELLYFPFVVIFKIFNMIAFLLGIVSSLTQVIHKRVEWWSSYWQKIVKLGKK